MSESTPQQDTATTAGEKDLRPKVGQGVLHLFFHVDPDISVDFQRASQAIEQLRSEGGQVVVASILGHKADLCVMALAPNLWQLRGLQTELVSCGFLLSDSYTSLTEVSEYAKGLPEKMLEARLWPQLPIPNKSAFCFYPMSKKREGHANWFSLDFDRRNELMHEHGTTGRKFAGRIVQLITGSAGFDDYEWGVTLFGQHPDDLKDVVYTMRFDEASAVYAEFGPFYVGMVTEITDLAASA